VTVSKPTLSDWLGWLGLSPTNPAQQKLLPVAHAALAACSRLSPAWVVSNGWWVNANRRAGGRPPRQHARHPLLGHFLSKLDSKRLALQYNIADSESDNDSLVESGSEDTAADSPSSVNRSGLLDESVNPLLSPPKQQQQQQPKGTDLQAGFAAAATAAQQQPQKQQQLHAATTVAAAAAHHPGPSPPPNNHAAPSLSPASNYADPSANARAARLGQCFRAALQAFADQRTS
jgi:hypothetical protein